MSQIKNLYTYLVVNQRAEVEKWLEPYCKFMGDVALVRTALLNDGSLDDAATYKGTAFEGKGWPALAQQLIYELGNGISSRGQSVLSWEKFNAFIVEADFKAAVAALIKDPSKANFREFSAAWERTRVKLGANRNPLLVNRTLAACTTDVTSTVNEAYFGAIYRWLVGKGFIKDHPDPAADWYDRNLQVMTYLREAFAEELREGKTSGQLLSMFVWYLFDNISSPFKLRKQVIKHGAPGTGKTYTAKQDVRLAFDIWREKYPHFGRELTIEHCLRVVQFHPSYGYEDFIEGLRPVPAESGPVQLQLQNGIFKDFCREAGKWEIEVYGIPEVGPALARRWLDLTVGDLKPFIGQHLAHASWKDLLDMSESEKISDIVPPYFFIIDEINRAELSRVLGELMLCLENRGVDGAIFTQYAALNREVTSMLRTPAGYQFFIPHNIYIVGTMNTIDRSVESFDLALRRRFRWEQVSPDMDTLRYHLKQRDSKPGNGGSPWVDLADSLAALNDKIGKTEILGEDYMIGHAYLMHLQYPPTLSVHEVRQQVWEDAIGPLLKEYLRGATREGATLQEFKKAFGA